MLSLTQGVVLAVLAASAATAPVADVPFRQEYHEAYPIAGGAAANDVAAVAVDGAGVVWAGGKAGVFMLRPGEKTWEAMTPPESAGPVYDVAVDGEGAAWIAAWDGLHTGTAEGIRRVDGVEGPVSAVCVTPEGIAAAGPSGLWRKRDGAWARSALDCSRSIRAMAPDKEGGLWIATGMGLYHHTPQGGRLYQLDDAILSADVCGVAHAPDGALWAGVLGGVTLYRGGERIAVLTPEDGIPSAFVQCVAAGPDGRMWVGTDKGVTRYDGKRWSLCHSRRWLLSDDVRDVAFGPGQKAWVATAKGVSAIGQQQMSLAEKADYFMEVLLKRHVRDPWIVEKCHLPVAGDTSQWLPEDDDNDGGYTAVYLVMECCRYAVTKSEEAKSNAKKAFDTLDFLQTVTETPGFFARTVVPPSWPEHPFQMHDRNHTHTERECAGQLVNDPRYKPVDVRWRPSSDGKWLWKGDTSSDEVTAHFFGFLFYYDLVADEAEKVRVRGLAKRIMDYIIDGGYVFRDIDGTYTRWGVWSPEKLNGDPDWRAERGINSLEILSFLKATYHMTGEDRYQETYLELLHKHGYAEHVRRAKTYQPSWRTHIDTELLAMAYPALLLYEKDPALQRLFRESFDHWYKGPSGEKSPYFNFTYAMLTGADPQLGDSIFFLRDTPLDLVRWRIDNTQREDVQCVRKPILEVLSTARLLPPSERDCFRWDKNPWEAIGGDGGHTVWAPTYWLLPYWMGRYCGFINTTN